MAGRLRQQIGPRKKLIQDDIANGKQLLLDVGDSAEEKLLGPLLSLSDRLTKNVEKYIELIDKLGDIVPDDDSDDSRKFDREHKERVDLEIQSDQIVADLKAKYVEVTDRIERNMKLGIHRVSEEAERDRLSVEKERLSLEKMRLDLEKKKMDDGFHGYGGKSVKLPKLEIMKFDGNYLHWMEFWDNFSSAVHNNKNLTDVDKMNYLKAHLEDDALSIISGLALTSDNYINAVQLLTETFGNKDFIISAHYNAFLDLPVAEHTTSGLRKVYDSFETHLRELENLGEDTSNSIYMSVMRSKLPKEVVVKLDELKDHRATWSVNLLRTGLRNYVTTLEFAEKTSAAARSEKATSSVSSHKYTAESLMARDKFVRRCIYCGGDHFNDECSEYKTVIDRKRKIRGHCYSCLKAGHSQGECKNQRICVHCSEVGHHRSLCIKKFPLGRSFQGATAGRKKESKSSDEKQRNKPSGDKQNNRSKKETKVKNDTSSSVNAEAANLSCGEQVLMQTATVKVGPVQKFESKAVRTRLMLDCGSQRSYISKDLATQLGLKLSDADDLKLLTFGASKPKTVKTKSAQLNIQLSDGSLMEITVHVVPQVTGTIHRRSIDKEKLKRVDSHYLADSLPHGETYTLQLLIGNDYYWELFPARAERDEISPGLYLIHSKLGYLLTGRTETNESSGLSYATLSMLTLTESHIMSSFAGFTELDVDGASVADLWKVDSIGIGDSLDDFTVEDFSQKVVCVDNRYQVGLPWREDIVKLPSNFGLAKGRLKSLVNKLDRNPNLKQQYDDVFQEQLHRGIIEVAPTEEIETDTVKHYIPHQPVINPERPSTKLRIVFDASAKCRKQPSLNELLHQGPVILEDLTGLLIRFRLHQYGVVADIEKAFHQVGLNSESRDFTRFLWLKDIDEPLSDENLLQFRFTRVPFGLICSPFLLAATIQHHLDKYESENAKKLKENFYVDNVVTGFSNKDEIKKFYIEAKQCMNDCSMNLREWASNCDEFCTSIPEEDRLNDQKIKVLGLNWNRNDDTLTIVEKRSQKKHVLTRRVVLSTVAKIFDPMGLLSPLLVKAKSFIQGLWKTTEDWDFPLNQSESDEWNILENALQEVYSHHIPRFVGGDNMKIVCFTDASAIAYATTVYLVTNNEANLIFSKSKICPLKEMSIPRLELQGVVIGIKSMEFVCKELRFPVDDLTLFTDSMCVLSWLTTSKRLPVFVKRRIDQIKSFQESSNCVYRYVMSEENPADIASRGAELNGLWWHGPNWLTSPKDEWPSVPTVDVDDVQEISKEKNTVIHVMTATTDEYIPESPAGMDINRFSSVWKLIRVTTRVLSFIQKLRRKQVDSSRNEKVAWSLWIKYVQKTDFADVYSAIKEDKPHQLKAQFDLYIDESDVIRCRGRMLLSTGKTDQVLLPRQNVFTHLCILKFHIELYHSGTSHTLAMLRQRFWIPKGRATVKKVLNQCFICKKHQVGPYKMPSMPNLPVERVTKSPAFCYTGLDYLGPLLVKDDKGVTSKVWICIFTCMAVRAIHLEVVTSLAATDFLLCLKRFFSRRGRPDMIICDNAPCFKSVASHLSDITWKFIVEYSPWMGGFYERLVGMVKKCLRKSLGRVLLTYTELETSICEIEAVINTRPLTYVDEDSSWISISPADFLVSNSLSMVPHITDVDRDNDYVPDVLQNDLELYLEQKQQKLNSFWDVWQSQYLPALQERAYRTHSEPRVTTKRCPVVGEVVLVKEDKPRNSWRLARIVEVLAGSDGEVRSAKVKTANGNVLHRPVGFLYPLECSDVTVTQPKRLVDDDTHLEDGTLDDQEPEAEDVIDTDNDCGRPKRKSAVRALDKIASWLKD